jgi:DNA-binding GntR family transcriptional regulator
MVIQFMDLSYTIRANAFNPEHLPVARRGHSVMIGLLGTRDSWALSQLCVEHIQYSKDQHLALLEPRKADYKIRRRQA